VYVLARTELVSMVPSMIPFPGAGVINNMTSEIRIVLVGYFSSSSLSELAWAVAMATTRRGEDRADLV